MRILAAILFCALLLSSTCESNSSAVPRTSLQMQVRHHERALADVDVRLYLHHSERPAADELESHDLNRVSSASGLVSFRDIPLGNHWFVGIGYDPLIGEQVVGHLSLRFDRRNLMQDTILFVGEEDFYQID